MLFPKRFGRSRTNTLAAAIIRIVIRLIIAQFLILLPQTVILTAERIVGFQGQP
jgi:hypothetical protein